MIEYTRIGIKRRRIVRTSPIISWYTILLISIINTISKSQIIGIGDVVDESTCYDDLYKSDADKDQWLNQTEFVTFVNLQSDGYFNVDSFDELPSLVQDVFDKSASCRECAVGNCCSEEDKAINVSGTGPNDSPSTFQSVKLFTLCSNAFATIDSVMTPAPTAAPSTLYPTDSPSVSPSLKPSSILVTPPFSGEPRISTTTLSPGSITFIALAAAAVGVISIGLIYRHQHPKRKSEQDLMNSPPPKPPQTQSNTLGASSPHYGPSPSTGGSKVTPVAVFPILSDDECSSKHSMDDIENQSHTSSSNAGSSGWSSSAGMSSMNTASVDDMEPDILLGGTLATIGLHSASASRLATNTSA